MYLSSLQVQLKWPLQTTSTTGEYACNAESSLAEKARAAPTVNFRWSRGVPLSSFARGRVFDSGGLMVDMDTILEEHELPDRSTPRWLSAGMRGLQSARDLPQWFVQGSPGYIINHAMDDTMVPLTDMDILPSEPVLARVPNHSSTLAAATWDAKSQTPVIGYALLFILCPDPYVYINRQRSYMWEHDPDGSGAWRWTSVGKVPIVIEGVQYTCKVLEDRPDVEGQPILDMTIPTSVVLRLRAIEREFGDGHPTREYFGYPLDDDSFHQQFLGQGPHPAIPSRSYDDW